MLDRRNCCVRSRRLSADHTCSRQKLLTPPTLSEMTPVSVNLRSLFKRAKVVRVQSFRGERFFRSLLSCPANGWSNGRHQFVQEYDCTSSGWKTCHLVLTVDRKQQCTLCD